MWMDQKLFLNKLGSQFYSRMMTRMRNRKSPGKIQNMKPYLKLRPDLLLIQKIKRNYYLLENQLLTL